MNVVDFVFAQDNPDAIALISGERKLSFGELEQAVDCAARLLLEAGLPVRAEGFVPRIGLACPNGLDHVILALAILRTGGCLVPVAGELVVPEREALIATVALHAVVVAGGLHWPERCAQEENAVPLPALEATLFLKPVRQPTSDSGFEESQLASLDPAFIRFSSGTTGRSKGVVLSHATLLARIETANRRLEIGPRDRVVWILPMAHHFAASIMLYLAKGAATIIVNSHLPEDVLDAGLRHGGTVLYGAPFHHALLAAEPSARPWPTLRLAVSTAAALPLATALAFDARYGIPLAQGLGIIEAGIPFLNTAFQREKPGSLGHPPEDVRLELRDPQKDRPVGVEEVGELLIHGEGLLDAYLNPWRLQREILVDGKWFRTGDLARLDADGCLHLVGRVKSVINVAGMKCFPEEVEAVLSTHPGVRSVRVSGREHPHYGAVPVADIIPASPPPTVASLLGHCQKALARYKVPVDFRFVQELPRTASGKLRRY